MHVRIQDIQSRVTFFGITLTAGSSADRIYPTESESLIRKVIAAPSSSRMIRILVNFADTPPRSRHRSGSEYDFRSNETRKERQRPYAFEEPTTEVGPSPATWPESALNSRWLGSPVPGSAACGPYSLWIKFI